MNRVSRKKKPPFLFYVAASVVIFFLALSAADSVGFIPCQLDGTCEEDGAALSQAVSEQIVTEQAPAAVVEMPDITAVPPTHIRIAAIDLDLPVQNPMTTDLAALDIILQKGPARHAYSGLLGDSRNMIIFGHSSHLPIVHNAMYKAFNRVPDLRRGLMIEIDGEDGATYLYRIASVQQEDSKLSTENFLANPDKQLIIVTCDTLTGKSARYVVKADFVGTKQ